jgi:hypothetical protein
VFGRRRNHSEDALAERITTFAGLATLVIGSWMVLDPARAGRVLSFSNPDPRRIRLGGLLDLTLAPGLLAAEHRRPWMIERAVFSAGFALNQRGPARGMSWALAVIDAAAAARLPHS